MRSGGKEIPEVDNDIGGVTTSLLAMGFTYKYVSLPIYSRIIKRMAKYTQGFFKPLNPQKYKGDPTQIVYRSGWELRLMSHFDTHPGVIWWSSEENIIKYRSPIDGRMHRYYPDFLICVKNKQGETKTVMIEVKPAKETVEPVKQKSMTKKYIREVYTWGVNKAKWSFAEQYCKERGWEFQIMTEKEIFGK